MSKNLNLILWLSIALLISCTPTSSQGLDTQPVSHQGFTELLKKHVDENGMVDYVGFKKDRAALADYLNLLRDNPPNDKNWSRNDQIAYWINAYNAFTIDLILQHYPLESIKDIGSFIQIPFVNTPWDIKFIKIGNEEYDLNNIEHGILRKKWEEPRIHFAVNCASFSCPRLRNEAYEGDKLDEQLNAQAIAFINNDALNDISAEKSSLSKIFDWYGGDFKKVMSLKDYINQYADELMTEKTKVSYKKYNWALNEQD